MKEIRQNLEYEGIELEYQLNTDLRNWAALHSVDAGIDWQFKYKWARLTDEDTLLFCIKHPHYTERFTNVKT